MLDGAFASHARYLPAQRAGFAETFHQDSASTAAQRGADAIADYLRGGPQAATSTPPSALPSPSSAKRLHQIHVRDKARALCGSRSPPSGTYCASRARPWKLMSTPPPREQPDRRIERQRRPPNCQ